MSDNAYPESNCPSNPNPATNRDDGDLRVGGGEEDLREDQRRRLGVDEEVVVLQRRADGRREGRAAQLDGVDVVYAFLSPAPMPALGEKARREMPPGSLFISNSFAVPDVEASDIVEIDDARQTRLYCYRM